MSASGFWRRYIALARKETRQMVRDRSNLTVGLLLPVVLILLFGYGLSFDLKNVPIAVVMDDHSPRARDVLSGLDGSSYLDPVWLTEMPDAERRMRNGEVIAILRVPNDFSQRLESREAKLQLLLNGVDTVTASSAEGYVAGAIGSWSEKNLDRAGNKSAAGTVSVEQRMWFNEARTSTWYLVPGLIVLVMTLIGAFLTSLLIAREWERGTLESLFVTPVRPLELVLAKVTPYAVVGTIDLVGCLLAARFLFNVPMHGSLWIIVGTAILYLVVSLLLGLLISGKTRNQFQASQVALVTSFMPALMLSGFVFDLRNLPAAVQAISHVLPATHFMGLIKTLFLAGNNWNQILGSGAILSFYAIVLIIAVRGTLRKQLH